MHEIWGKMYYLLFSLPSRSLSILPMYLIIFHFNSRMNQQCKVCGEPAAGFHFGAFTCEGCKVSAIAYIIQYLIYIHTKSR